MKFSVIVNPEGDIVGAVIPTSTVLTTGPFAVDQLNLPEGHKMHEVEASPELAKDFLDGNFSRALQHYKLEYSETEISLKRR